MRAFQLGGAAHMMWRLALKEIVCHCWKFTLSQRDEKEKDSYSLQQISLAQQNLKTGNGGKQLDKMCLEGKSI